MLLGAAKAAGLIFLSTPFDEESADMLESLGVPALKVSSGDLTHLPFLKHLARKGLPIVLSTGMATVSEIESKLAEVRTALDGEDASAIRTKSEDLMQASHKLAEAVYQRVQADQQSTGAADGSDGAGESDDEVVEEADYEVIDEEAKSS